MEIIYEIPNFDAQLFKIIFHSIAVLLLCSVPLVFVAELFRYKNDAWAGDGIDCNGNCLNHDFNKIYKRLPWLENKTQD